MTVSDTTNYPQMLCFIFPHRSKCQQFTWKYNSVFMLRYILSRLPHTHINPIASWHLLMKTMWAGICSKHLLNVMLWVRKTSAAVFIHTCMGVSPAKITRAYFWVDMPRSILLEPYVLFMWLYNIKIGLEAVVKPFLNTHITCKIEKKLKLFCTVPRRPFWKLLFSSIACRVAGLTFVVLQMKPYLPHSRSTEIGVWWERNSCGTGR